MTSIPDDPNLQQTGTPRIAEAVYQKFYEDWVKALASLIEADAQRAAETDVATLYVQYLQVLAPLVASTRDDKLMLAVQPALDKLAAKSASFAAEVKPTSPPRTNCCAGGKERPRPVPPRPRPRFSPAIRRFRSSSSARASTADWSLKPAPIPPMPC